MDKETREKLAWKMLRRCNHFSLEEIKTFADMLTAAELPTGRPGQEERTLKSVDVASIMEKLAVYKDKRDMALREVFENTKKEAEIAETNKPLDAYKLTHDLWGNILPANVDPYQYWRSRPTQEELNRLDVIIRPKLDRLFKHTSSRQVVIPKQMPVVGIGNTNKPVVPFSVQAPF